MNIYYFSIFHLKTAKTLLWTEYQDLLCLAKRPRAKHGGNGEMIKWAILSLVFVPGQGTKKTRSSDKQDSCNRRDRAVGCDTPSSPVLIITLVPCNLNGPKINVARLIWVIWKHLIFSKQKFISSFKVNGNFHNFFC